MANVIGFTDYHRSHFIHWNPLMISSSTCCSVSPGVLSLRICSSAILPAAAKEQHGMNKARSSPYFQQFLIYSDPVKHRSVVHLTSSFYRQEASPASFQPRYNSKCVWYASMWMYNRHQNHNRGYDRLFSSSIPFSESSTSVAGEKNGFVPFTFTMTNQY